MSIFKRKKQHESLPPLTPPSTPEAERILATIEALELNHDEVVLVGSAALVLYGAELSDTDPLTDQTSPRPGDVDFASTASYMEQLHAQGTPSGLKATVKPNVNSQTVLRIETPDSALPADVITRYRVGYNMERFDQKFRAYMPVNSRAIVGTSARVLTPDRLEHELKQNASLTDPKARSDLAAFRRARQK